MFRCATCGRVSGPREKANKVTISTRPKEYRHKVLDKKGRPVLGDNKEPLVKVSNGKEIIQEITICGHCA